MLAARAGSSITRRCNDCGVSLALARTVIQPEGPLAGRREAGDHHPRRCASARLRRWESLADQGPPVAQLGAVIPEAIRADMRSLTARRGTGNGRKRTHIPHGGHAGAGNYRNVDAARWLRCSLSAVRCDGHVLDQDCLKSGATVGGYRHRRPSRSGSGNARRLPGDVAQPGCRATGQGFSTGCRRLRLGSVGRFVDGMGDRWHGGGASIPRLGSSRGISAPRSPGRLLVGWSSTEAAPAPRFRSPLRSGLRG